MSQKLTSHETRVRDCFYRSLVEEGDDSEQTTSSENVKGKIIC